MWDVAEACAFARSSPADIVCAEAVLESMGIAVSRRPLSPGVRGLSHGRTVWIAEDLHEDRAQFVLAHELAHVLVRQGRGPKVSGVSEERYADAFALECVAPEAAVERCSELTSIKAAARLGAPHFAIVWRRSLAGLLPAVQIVEGDVVCRDCGLEVRRATCRCAAVRRSHLAGDLLLAG